MKLLDIESESCAGQMCIHIYLYILYSTGKGSMARATAEVWSELVAPVRTEELNPARIILCRVFDLR